MFLEKWLLNTKNIKGVVLNFSEGLEQDKKSEFIARFFYYRDLIVGMNTAK